MSFYAENAVLLPTAEPQIEGKEAIREEWEHLLEIPGFESKSKLARVDVSAGGDMAFTAGSYEARMMGEDGAEVVEPGKWVSIWRKQTDGAWQVVLETYNTDIPPPDHK